MFGGTESAAASDGMIPRSFVTVSFLHILQWRILVLKIPTYNSDKRKQIRLSFTYVLS